MLCKTNVAKLYQWKEKSRESLSSAGVSGNLRNDLVELLMKYTNKNAFGRGPTVRFKIDIKTLILE